MAANGSIRHIFYRSPNMFGVAKHLRIVNRKMATMSTTNHISKTSVKCVWSQDPSLPLPGNVGLDINALDSDSQQYPTKQPSYESLASAFLNSENETTRKQQVLKQFMNEKLEEQCDGDLDDEPSTTYIDTLSNNVECKVQSCPQSLVKGFKDLFDGIPTSSAGDFTVITIGQKTANDMTSWSQEVDDERQVLIGTFIENAKVICTKIKNNGYWADFIEPESGCAFYGGHRNETLFETDDRMNQLGFTIDDLGCCKVLLHKDWKSFVFVGVIFTDAPVQSHVFENI